MGGDGIVSWQCFRTGLWIKTGSARDGERGDEEEMTTTRLTNNTTMQEVIIYINIYKVLWGLCAGGGTVELLVPYHRETL